MKQLEQWRAPKHTIAAQTSPFLQLLVDEQAEEIAIDYCLYAYDEVKRHFDLRESDFYFPRNRLILKAIEQCPRDNIVAVADWLEAEGELDNCGGRARLFDCAHFRSFLLSEASIKKVIDLARRREVFTELYTSAKNLSDLRKPVDEVLSHALQSLNKLVEDRRGTTRVKHASEAAMSFYERFERRHENRDEDVAFPTGYPELDEILQGGIKRRRLCVVAGRPGMGKTAFVVTSMINNIAGNPLQKCRRGLFYSLEMADDEIFERIVSQFAKLETGRLWRGKLSDLEVDNVVRAVGESAKIDLWIDTTSRSIHEIEMQTKRMKFKHNIDYVVIDYLAKIEAAGDTEYERLNNIVERLNRLGDELDIAVVLLCQLSRKVEDRKDKRPHQGDLSGTGRIEQEADVILMLYRDEYYNKATRDRNIAEVIVEKNRQGRIGMVNLFFDAKLTRFGSMIHSNAKP